MPRFDQIDSSLFAGLDPAARSDVERHMEPRQLGAGEVLCREGEEGGSLFVVTNGLLHAVAASGAVLGRQRPGDVVGEAALLTGEPRSATLVARLPSEVLELSRDAFLAAAGRHPPLLINLARIVSHRMVARTSGAGGGRRAEAVAIVVGRSGWPDAEAALAAATASSPAASSIFDLTRPNAPLTAGVLAALEFSRRQQQRVFVVLGSDHEDLHLLLDYCDRSVALMSAEEAHELAGTRKLPVERLAPVTTTGNVGRLGRHLAGTKLGLALGAGARRPTRTSVRSACSNGPGTSWTTSPVAAWAAGSGRGWPWGCPPTRSSRRCGRRSPKTLGAPSSVPARPGIPAAPW